MTIVQLKYALSVEKYRNFRLAAEHLSISQPALSLQIRKLEETIGLVLFDRSVSPVETTPDGILFLSKAEEIVNHAENLLNFTSVLGENFNGKLKLGVIPTLAPYLIPLFAYELQKDHPLFTLEIHEMITNDIIHALRTGELDAGLISTPINIQGIKSIPLFYELFYFYTSEELTVGGELHLEDIDYSKLWLLNEGNCIRDQINNFCDISRVDDKKTFYYNSNSIESLIRIVDSRGGFTILPELTTLSLDEHQIQQTLPIYPKAREIGIVYSKSSFKERFVLKMMEYIKNNIPKKMLSSEGLEVMDPEIEIG
ncbi:MAG: LysR substrate-binding domain-containing protein [Cyclobacteriaceae bacterium]|nr:LysR substrate-binding domain-containing protein [Cyclobacteriaceae bacterium]